MRITSKRGNWSAVIGSAIAGHCYTIKLNGREIGAVHPAHPSPVGYFRLGERVYNTSLEGLSFKTVEACLEHVKAALKQAITEGQRA